MPHHTLKGGDVRVKPALALVASACTDRGILSHDSILYLSASLWLCECVVLSLTLTARSGRTKRR